MSATGTFASSEIGENIVVYLSDLTLIAGAGDVNNYKLASTGQQETTTGSIYALASVNITYDTQNHGNPSWGDWTTLSDNTVPKPDEEKYGKADGLRLEGWYKEPECKNKWEFSYMTTTYPITLYANWVPDSDETAYWIAPAKDVVVDNEEATSNDAYVSATTNVKKSSEEIRADIVTMKREAEEGSADGDASVTSQYKNFMSSDKYHLYTRWLGSTIDGSNNKQDENMYAEFRIIEVGSHDGDGSTLTFQSVYAFPEARAMNDEPSSEGGWANSSMQSYLNTEGSSGFLGGLYSGFYRNVIEVKKGSTNGEGPDITAAIENQFWLASVVELTGTDEEGYADEGSQYAYYQDKSLLVPGEHPGMKRLTRAGYGPLNYTGGDSKGSAWWTRSPSVTGGGEQFNRVVGGATQLIKSMDADNALGVVPCFCF